MAKKIGKKKHKIDPIIRLAEKNKSKSITAVQMEKNEQIKRRVITTHEYNDDPQLSNVEADQLFREMKRRDF